MHTKALHQPHAKALLLLVTFIALAIFSASCGGGTTAAVPNAAASLAVNLSPASLSFGSQPVESSSSAQTVTLINSGSAALTLSSLALTGTNASDFAQTNNCGSSVPAGANCTISVTFTPSASGRPYGFRVNYRQCQRESPDGEPFRDRHRTTGQCFSHGPFLYQPVGGNDQHRSDDYPDQFRQRCVEYH